MVSNTAFEFLRQHKKVEPETEALVLKRVSGKITTSDLLTCFEKGITGEFGKVYSLDPQTLIGWVTQFLRSKTSSKNYLETGLLPPDKPFFDLGNDDWMKEANKCLTSFLNGVSESYFHPNVYDRMMLDGKIELNACMKYGDNVIEAKQKVLRDVFLTYKSKGWSRIYFV